MNKLLIVDDEIKIRTVIREYAEFNDYIVDEAADGLEAVNKVKEHTDDFVEDDIFEEEDLVETVSEAAKDVEDAVKETVEKTEEAVESLFEEEKEDNTEDSQKTE